MGTSKILDLKLSYIVNFVASWLLWMISTIKIAKRGLSFSYKFLSVLYIVIVYSECCNELTCEKQRHDRNSRSNVIVQSKCCNELTFENDRRKLPKKASPPRRIEIFTSPVCSHLQSECCNELNCEKERHDRNSRSEILDHDRNSRSRNSRSRQKFLMYRVNFVARWLLVMISTTKIDKEGFSSSQKFLQILCVVIVHSECCNKLTCEKQRHDRNSRFNVIVQSKCCSELTFENGGHGKNCKRRLHLLAKILRSSIYSHCA